MKRKIAYVMSLITLCFTILILLAQSVMVEAITFDDINITQTISRLVAEANGSTMVGIGFTSEDECEQIGDRTYYRILSTKTSIYVPVFIINPKATVYKVSYETAEYTALAGTDYTEVSGDIYIKTDENAKLYGTSSGTKYYYSYVTISATQSMFRIDNDFYENSYFNDENISVDNISYGNEFFFSITSIVATSGNTDCTISAALDTVAIQLPGTINDNYMRYLNGDYTDYNSKLDNPEETVLGGVSMYTNLTYRSLGYYFDYTDVTVSDVDGLDDDSDKVEYANLSNVGDYSISGNPYIDAGLANLFINYSGKYKMKSNVTDDAWNRIRAYDTGGTKIFDVTSYSTGSGKSVTSSSSESGGNPIYLTNDTSHDSTKYIQVDSTKASKIKLEYTANTFWHNVSLYDQSIHLKIGDITAPKVVGVSLDTSKITSTNHKVYYRIRLSEPVYAPTNAGFLAGVNGNMSPDSGYELRFRYYGGSLTNTLIFETDLDDYKGKGKYLIKNITPLGVANLNTTKLDYFDRYSFTETVNSKTVRYSLFDVRDLSPLLNSLGSDEYGVLEGFDKVTCSIDTRLPNIQVTHTNTIAKTHTTTFSLSDCSTGTVYYAFTDNLDDTVDWSTAAKFVYDAGDEDEFSKQIVTSGYDGIKYIHVKAINSFGLEQTEVYYGIDDKLQKYQFDSSGPTATITASDSNTTKSRTYTISATDLPSDSSSGVKTIYVKVYDEDETELISLTANRETYTFTIVASGDGNSVGLGDGERGSYTIIYYVIDELENKSEEYTLKTQFDTNDYFDGEISADSNSTTILNDEDNRELVLISNTVDTTNSDDTTTVYMPTTLTITFTDPAGTAGAYEIINNFSITDSSNNTYSYADFTFSSDSYIHDYFTATISDSNLVSDGSDRVFTLKFTGHNAGTLDYGYFDIRLETDQGRSFVYRVYIGTDGENTSNIETINNTNIILNNVVKLSTDYSLFYYLEETDNVISVNTVKYHSTATTPNPVFSSKIFAREFVYAMEFKDITAVTLTSDQATLLAADNGGYYKATGETTTPQAGQVWIRYKISSWTASSTSSAWRYYYYSDTSNSSTVNPGAFSSNLLNAINSVTDTICASLYSDYLVDDVDDYGNPRVSATATFADAFTVTKSLSGTVFSNPISYSGDTAIYINNIKVDGNSYKLAKNYYLSISSNTRLYFYDSDNDKYYPISSDYDDYNVYDALKEVMELDEADLTSKVIYLYEFDSSGSNSIALYLDVVAPQITVNVVDVDGVSGAMTVSSNNKNVSITGSYISLVSLIDEDSYSYVIVRTYIRANVGTFLNFYRADDITESSPVLSGGNYIVTVSDRSGNSYSFYVFVNDTTLSVNQTVVENEYYKIECNRTSDQISLFEVYFNGALVTNTYDLTKKYTASGLYRIYIRDIYGNTYDEYYEFERDYPVVTWSYYIDGSYTTYKETEGTCPMKLTGTGEGEYTIVTNTSLAFVYSSSCTVTFEVEPSTYTMSETTNKVTIGASGEATSFVLRVAYSNLPSVYTRYICIVDTSAPLIKARCTYPTYDLDTDSTNLVIEDGAIKTPVSFWYDSMNSATNNHNIEDGTVEYADTFNINVSDEYTIYSIEVYLNGEKVKYLSNQSNCSFDMTGYGTYTIIATDIYGNKSEFNFENRDTSGFGYVIDGTAITLSSDLTGYFNDSTLEFEDIYYGHESTVLRLMENGAFRVILRHGDDVSYAVFKFDGTYLTEYKYIVYTLTDGTQVLGTEYANRYLFVDGATETITLGNLSFTIQYVADPTAQYYKNSLKVIFNVIDDDEYTVDFRFDSELGFPYYVKFGLSTYTSGVKFYNQLNEEIGVTTTDQVKISEQFTISTDTDADILVLYDAAGHFIYANNIYEYGKYYSDEGAYLVSITNKYGNVSKYNVIYYESYLVAVNIVYEDTTSFSLNNPKEAYSNYIIKVILYDESTITITKDGEEFTPEVTFANEVYSFKLTLEGDYELSLVNTYGSKFEFSAHIKNETLEEDNLLSGYNEDALRRSDGYTNQALTIDYDVANNYSYVGVKYGDNDTIVLKDTVTGSDIALDASILAGYIGSLGDGTYDVIIRDIYGNSHIDKVYYRGTNTFTLERRIRTSVENEEYSIEKAVELGFWSNSSLLFETAATTYQFTLDGKEVSLPYKLSYAGTENDGAYIYKITYIDEYGFKYEFDAHLVRTTLNLAVSEDAKAIEIEGIMTTKYSFTMLYDDTISSCSYIKDSVSYPYSGQEISEDGVYRFVATDLAGNNTSFTIVKDSIVEFAFKNSASVKQVIFGETITILRLSFTSVNGDSSYIYAAYKDGEKIKDITDIYNEVGTYEFLIRDAVGNETYFKFRMINNVVGSFEYETPYSYLVTSVIYYTKLIPEISYMEYVEQFADYSKMSFKEDGFYEITTQSKDTGEIIKLSFEINTAAPEATLTGVANGGTTINDVNLDNLKAGDVVEVYRNGTLVNTYYIAIDGDDITSIKDGGKYKIVITNAAGVSSTLEFTRKHTANVAGSALVVIGSVVAVGLIFFGILQHNKKKTDI
ncbi:MAG: hypothetical protein K6A63_05170 [Acholeplasmatales bacterium]|nr:hypothetical protein [Acholeplasmatales bacterium]